MTLFEINEAFAKAIENGIDEETGEITNLEELERLNLERNVKIENTAKYIINMRAEVKALKEREEHFKGRRQTLEKRIDALERNLEYNLNGEAFESIDVNISYRQSRSVEISDTKAFEEFISKYPEYRKEYVIEPNKTLIKQAILDGMEIPGATLTVKKNMQIK
jgi:hypothetical protein